MAYVQRLNESDREDAMRRKPWMGPWAVACLLVGGLTPARADLHFVTPTIDLGAVRGGMTLGRRFSFVNDGSEVIEVTGIHVSCGCLKPRLETRVYKPGDQGELLLEVNPLSQSDGPHSWAAHVTYRLGDQAREQQVVLTGKIIALVAVQPASITLIPDRAPSHQLTITDVRPRPMEVSELRTSSPRLRARAADAAKDERGRWVRTVTLEVDADYPEGRHDEILEIHTPDPDYRVMKIPVTVVRRAKEILTATPNSIELKIDAGRPMPSRLVLIRDREDRPVEIDAVETDQAGVTCQWSKGPQTPATVRLRVDGQTVGEASPKGTLRVHVIKPVEQTLSVPLTVTGR
jgi:hypothetical protein